MQPFSRRQNKDSLSLFRRLFACTQFRHFFAGLQFDSDPQEQQPLEQLNHNTPADSSDSCVLSGNNGIQGKQWVVPEYWEFHVIAPVKLTIPPPMPKIADAGATVAGNLAQ